MIRGNTHILRRLLLIADLCLVALSFQVSLNLFSHNDLSLTKQALSDSVMLVGVAIWGLMLWGNRDNYVFRGKQVYRVIKPALSASLKASAIFIAYIFCLDLPGFGHGQLALFLIVSTSGLCFERLALHRFLRYYRAKGYDYQNVIVVGNGHQAKVFADHILKNPQWGLRIPGFIEVKHSNEKFPKMILWSYQDIPCIGGLDDLPEILKSREVEWVVFGVEKEDLGLIEKAFLATQQMGIRAAILTDFFPQVKARRQAYEFMEQAVMIYDTAPPAGMALLFKNIFDRLAAAVALMLLWPLMIATAIAIRIFTGKSILYKQVRIGLNGRRFAIYKFRTMVPDADILKEALLNQNEIDGAAFKMKDDPRVTRLGRVLRKTSIDELPQLFNVLKGDMSLVGPRPPLEEEVSRYDFWQTRKLSVRPGLTCLWQVNGRSDVKFEDWMKMDLHYIDNWSIWLDMKILARTIPAVLTGKGAK